MRRRISADKSSLVPLSHAAPVTAVAAWYPYRAAAHVWPQQFRLKQLPDQGSIALRIAPENAGRAVDMPHTAASDRAGR
jgi:hypothetical protein